MTIAVDLDVKYQFKQTRKKKIGLFYGKVQIGHIPFPIVMGTHENHWVCQTVFVCSFKLMLYVPVNSYMYVMLGPILLSW